MAQNSESSIDFHVEEEGGKEEVEAIAAGSKSLAAGSEARPAGSNTLPAAS